MRRFLLIIMLLGVGAVQNVDAATTNLVWRGTSTGVVDQTHKSPE